jgi:hypothetical protein
MCVPDSDIHIYALLCNQKVFSIEVTRQNRRVLKRLNIKWNVKFIIVLSSRDNLPYRLPHLPKASTVSCEESSEISLLP